MASFFSLGVTTELLFYFFFSFFSWLPLFIWAHTEFLFILILQITICKQNMELLSKQYHGIQVTTLLHIHSVFCESKSYVLVLYDMHKKIIPLIKWSSHQIVAFFVSTLSMRIRFSFWCYCLSKFTLFWMSFGCLFVFWRLIWLTLLLI